MKVARQDARPPKWAIRFFKWYCTDHLSEAILGDMEELYTRRRKKMPKTKADLLFVWNVINFLQPFAIRNRSNTSTLNHSAMFRNYIKIAWRSMSRQKMYTAIKIGGFALGLATCFLIFLFIRNEVSYDSQYGLSSNVYRVYNSWEGPDDSRWVAFPASMGGLLKSQFPEIENSGRLIPYNWFKAGSNLVREEHQTENTYEEGFAYADQSLLEVLNIPMVYGNQKLALGKPNSLVISKKIADKYFPNQDPVGKIFILNEDRATPFTVGGVMEDFKFNSHLHYDFLLSLANVEFWPGEQASWCCWNYNVYVKLRPDANIPELEKKMLSIRESYLLTHMQETGDQNLADTKKYHHFRLQPASDIYLNEINLEDEGHHGDIRYIWLFAGIAIFILLLACVNFINLSTAKSANRAKEVGLRKVVGSLRGYLISQFLTESLIYSFISFAIGMLLITIALPTFNQLTGKHLVMPWSEWWLYPMLVFGAVFVGALAGLYPSFYLSGFKPVDVLKGSVSRGSKSSALRGVMVVFQFTTSIILIVSTLAIYKQMDYILNTKIGFEKDHVVMIQGLNTLPWEKTEPFKDELRKLPGVTNVTVNNYLPVAGTKRDQNMFWKEGRSKIDKGVGGQVWYVDEDYLATMGMKLIEGRNFDRAIASDSAAIIVNQTMAKQLGLSKPVGEGIMNWRNYHIIGVVEDFNFESLKFTIGPLSLVRGKGGSIACVKIQTQDMPKTIQSITGVWNQFVPNQPFRYTFLDESYTQMYEDVQLMGGIFGGFSLLAIIIACLGLFALSAFMVEQRSKEISIRLVLGASIQNIFRLLTQNFVGLVLISFIIATPCAWYMMTKWLQGFNYKTDITVDIFLIAGLLAIMIALLTISYQAIRAALANPAVRLRSE